MQIQMNPGERLMFRAPISLVAGKTVNQVGVCYLTDQRLIIHSEGMLSGLLAGISVLARTALKKGREQRGKVQEIPLRQLSKIQMQKYGLNQTVNLPLMDGSQLRIVFDHKTRRRFLQFLDEALRAQGLERVPAGENAWRVRPRMGG